MLARLFGTKPEERTVASLPWGSWGNEGSATYAGVNVTPELSLQLLTVYGCVRMICDAISTMPVDVFRKDGDRKIEVAAPMWIHHPTTSLGWIEWVSQVLTSLLLHGNAFVMVKRSSDGRIVELVPLDPARVTVRRDGGRKVFLVSGREWPDEILHLCGMMLPGSDVGLSPVEYARQSIGLGLATLEYGSKFFDSEGNMPGVIEIPGKAQPEQMREMANLWKRKRSRVNRGMPGVLESGATWKPTGVTNEQAQFLATRNFSQAEIAGQMFLLDPSDLGIPVAGTSLVYGNIEQRNARRLQVTFLPWIVRIEKAVSGLFATQFVKLNVDGLLRGDTAARWTSYEAAARINTAAVAIGQEPVMLTSEMREFEDWSPVDAPVLPLVADVKPVRVEPMSVSVAIDNRTEPATVSVSNVLPDQPAPVVNVTNDVRAAEALAPVVNVTNDVVVPELAVTVMAAAERRTVRTVERDSDGRIARVIDEVR